MRSSGNFAIPISLITLYYVAWITGTLLILSRFPALASYFPIGGIGTLAGYDLTDFEPIYSSVEVTVLDPKGPLRLVFACAGAAVLIIPVSWVYFITSRTKELDQSFAQTIVVLPIVVTGIAMIVLNSLALAFSLAGIVAAVRFRFSLRNPAHAMYIMASIGIGLGSGIGALGVACVISIAFVYANLIIWKLEYGKTLSGPFLAMLTRRDRAEDDS